MDRERYGCEKPLVFGHLGDAAMTGVPTETERTLTIGYVWAFASAERIGEIPDHEGLGGLVRIRTLWHRGSTAGERRG